MLTHVEIDTIYKTPNQNKSPAAIHLVARTTYGLAATGRHATKQHQYTEYVVCHC